LFGIGASVDDDAAATRRGVDRSLDRLASSDTNRLIASFLSYRFRSVRHRCGVIVVCQTFGFWQSRSTNEWHEQCNEEDVSHHADSVLTTDQFNVVRPELTA